jgi:NAD(P)-dependent dehydrogenase (short-subunit alcohol dehydrogenase family)
VTFGAQRTGYATCVPVAIVTGSDSGIGKATAVQLARDGFDLGITWHRDEQGANETAEEVRQLGRRAEVRQLDLLQLPGAAAVVDELIDALGGIDVLVNNSGTSREGKAVDLSYDQWRETLLVDLDGAFLCSQRAARKMIEQGHGGRIVNVTSVHEYKPIVDGVAYTVAKHGLGGLTKQLAFELGRHGITVNSVAPGMVATPMTDMEDEDPRQQEKPEFPLGRPGDAREIASCIGWLCSDGAAWTTGASFVVDGGYLLVSPSSMPQDLKEATSTASSS